MNNNATIARATRPAARPAARHEQHERRPSPLAGVVFCLVVFAGGAVGAQHWLTDVCPTTPALGQVCEVANVPVQ